VTTSALVVAVLILVIIAGEARTRRGGWSRAAGSLGA
jgi:hypothetical protein